MKIKSRCAFLRSYMYYECLVQQIVLSTQRRFAQGGRVVEKYKF